MIPPSPYTFKWPVTKNRPIFNIGKITEDLNPNVNVMTVNNRLNNILTKLLDYKQQI